MRKIIGLCLMGIGVVLAILAVIKTSEEGGLKEFNLREFVESRQPSQEQQPE